MILGLTGSLGSGKSTVARMLEELGGAKVIDADEIARRTQVPGGEAYDEIVEAFGRGILDAEGRIDRKGLASIVFSDDGKLEILNSIVHSKVRDEELRQLELHKDHPLVVLMVPLLLEVKSESLVDRVVVVTLDEENRRKRLWQRSQMTEEEIGRRLRAQMPQEEKARRADFVIDNSGTPEQTREQVRALLARLGLPDGGVQ